jgi:hypothetical protein
MLVTLLQKTHHASVRTPMTALLRLKEYSGLELNGADEGNRTSDLRITNALLYQLSYIG